MNKKSKCIGTPKVVLNELNRLGIITTGNRTDDIPKYWDAMSKMKTAAGSPKAQLEAVREIWRNNKDEL